MKYSIEEFGCWLIKQYGLNIKRKKKHEIAIALSVLNEFEKLCEDKNNGNQDKISNE